MNPESGSHIANRRSDARRAVNRSTPVVVESTRSRSVVGWVCDVSDSGVGFRCYEELPEEVLIELEPGVARRVQICHSYAVSEGIWRYGARFVGTENAEVGGERSTVGGQRPVAGDEATHSRFATEATGTRDRPALSLEELREHGGLGEGETARRLVDVESSADKREACLVTVVLRREQPRIRAISTIAARNAIRAHRRKKLRRAKFAFWIATALVLLLAILSMPNQLTATLTGVIVLGGVATWAYLARRISRCTREIRAARDSLDAIGDPPSVGERPAGVSAPLPDKPRG